MTDRPLRHLRRVGVTEPSTTVTADCGPVGSRSGKRPGGSTAPSGDGLFPRAVTPRLDGAVSSCRAANPDVRRTGGW